MSTTTDRLRKIEELREQLEAAEKEQRAEEKRERARVQQVKKAAGEAHVRTVLALYDRLDIEAATPTSRTVKGVATEVARDRDESVRTERLLFVLENIIDAADPELIERLQTVVDDQRDERRFDVEKAKADLEQIADGAQTDADDDDESVDSDPVDREAYYASA